MSPTGAHTQGPLALCTVHSQSAARCVLQVAEDGSCIYAYAQGTSPTGWRTRPDEPWRWMQPGESVALGTGNKVSLDCNDPQACVFKFEKNDPKFALGPARRDLVLLPAGWVSELDQASGQAYYTNQQTGQSQWEPPPAWESPPAW